MANSLARSSRERAPSFARGSLNTPCSSRLYHNTKPSRSQCRIFNRSLRRERNTKRCPLSASSPITVFTRSAKRSNPQRMSGRSTASQMRTACAPSSARKLGSPITPLPLPPPTTLALARGQIPVPPPGCVHCAAVSPPAPHSARWAPAPLPPPSLPRTRWPPPASPPCPSPPQCSRAAASSTSKNAARSTRAPGRTPPHSARCAPARKSLSATSPTPAHFVLVASYRNAAILTRAPTRCASRTAHAVGDVAVGFVVDDFALEENAYAFVGEVADFVGARSEVRRKGISVL